MMGDSERVVPPDERVFRAHVAGARFQSRVDRGDWHLIEIEWPHALIAVSAAERQNGPEEFVFRFELSGYPTTTPTATPWDSETNAVLPPAKRPKGYRVGMAFRTDWNEGLALYVPYDRVAIDSHPNWRTQHPRYLWDATKDITFYLRNVHDLLNNEDYEGT
jgi:hypothetical protein